MSDLFTEIQQDIQKDRTLALWKRTRWWLLALVLAIVAGVAGWQAYSSWQKEERQNDARAFFQALKASEQKAPSAISLARLEKIAKKDNGYALLASLQLARLWTLKQDKEKAARALAHLKNQPIVYQDLAALLEDVWSIQAGADPKNLAELSQAERPFRPLAMELRALLALQNQQFAQASKILQEIAGDSRMPFGPRRRARQFLQIVPQDSQEQDPKKKDSK